MIDGHVIAEIRDYPEFTAALRAWIAELNTTYESIGELAGLQDGYLAKLIASTPVRSFSRISLGNTLGAMGVKLLLAVDAERLAALRPRYTLRKKHASEPMLAMKSSVKPRKLRNLRNPLVGNPTLAALYAHRRAVLQTPRRRRLIARKAAIIRWAHS